MKAHQIFASIFVLTAVIVGCSKDDGNKQYSFSNSEPDFLISFPSEISDYLDDFYNNSTYSIGTSISTTDSTLGSFTVTEVILEGDSNARGFVCMDGNEDYFLYFVDVDRSRKELSFHDIVNETSETFYGIDSLEYYNETNEFDYMYIIDNINHGLEPNGDTPDPNAKKRKFIGSVTTIGPPLLGMCWQCTTFYIFWIGVQTTCGSVAC